MTPRLASAVLCAKRTLILTSNNACCCFGGMPSHAYIVLIGGGGDFLSYKSLDHQPAVSSVRTEVLTYIGELLEQTIGH